MLASFVDTVVYKVKLCAVLAKLDPQPPGIGILPLGEAVDGRRVLCWSQNCLRGLPSGYATVGTRDAMVEIG